MTRGEYNDYQGWQIPADENPDDPGYLVGYPDANGLFTGEFEGDCNYISWSPKDVFEVSYKNIASNPAAGGRRVEGHKVNPANDVIEIDVLDAPGAGGANHEYAVTLPNGHITRISFQNGAIAEAGVNGLTQEVLIAICIDRLKSFQAGEFSCRENALALTKLQEAQHWLHHRTRERMTRGVEGTNEK